MTFGRGCAAWAAAAAANITRSSNVVVIILPGPRRTHLVQRLGPVAHLGSVQTAAGIAHGVDARKCRPSQVTFI
eukprot:COSAG01_NODE_21762_length_886_cov_1.099111_2_plen_73_part_01